MMSLGLVISIVKVGACVLMLVGGFTGLLLGRDTGLSTLRNWGIDDEQLANSCLIGLRVAGVLAVLIGIALALVFIVIPTMQQLSNR